MTVRCLVAVFILLLSSADLMALERLKYRNPGLQVDLGVGLWAWPLPMDYDADGDLDLVVACPDVPYNGTWFFENPGGDAKMPVFKPGVRIGAGPRNVQVSYVKGKPLVTGAGVLYRDFMTKQYGDPRKLPVKDDVHRGKIRANQWKFVDFDSDDRLDLVVGIGDWTKYGWDNAFDRDGVWQNGPLQGFVYWLRNEGTNDSPQYTKQKLTAGGQPIDVYGMPSPNVADFDGDGDLDLICGEFTDGFTWFENVGTRTRPQLAAGRRLPVTMDLCMITPVAIDWDRDNDVDLIVGEEDGRVAFLENTGKVVDGIPEFLAPRHFQQQADEIKFGALVTPVSHDWDADGDEDLVCGNTAGYIGWIENLGGGQQPRWAAPKYLESAGRPIRIMAGENGSIQGPCERKWGYTTLSAADWNHDGLTDLVVNSIWGKVVWYENVGRNGQPEFGSARPVTVRWPQKAGSEKTGSEKTGSEKTGPEKTGSEKTGSEKTGLKTTGPKPAWNWWDPRPGELATQWRTTPVVLDWNEDGLHDLVMLDHEGYLAWFERVRHDGQLTLLPGQRVFLDEKKQPLRLNSRTAGKSGRRKICVADWDGDGRRDLLVNSRNVDWLRNVAGPAEATVLRSMGPVSDHRLAGHTTSPTTVDWDQDGKRDLLIGAEDGFLYYLKYTN